MRRRHLALTAVVALVLALLLLWMGRGQPPQPARRAEVPQPDVGRVARPRAMPHAQALPEAPSDEPATIPIPATIRLDERLAAVRGQLHVRCWVGEEYSPVRGVEDGWFATNTEKRTGSATIGDLHHDSLLVVRWSAPEGATTATCTTEPPRWAYLTVQVTEQDGGPAAGVGVAGCGVLHETGDDGRIDFPVLVRDEPCSLDVYRWAPDTLVHSQAFVRVTNLTEGEERTVFARLKDFPRAEGDPMIRFDWKSLEALQEDRSGVPELLPDQTLDDQLEDYEDRLASTIGRIADLEKVLPLTPEEERWAVEEAIARAQRSRQGFEDYLQGLQDQATTDQEP